MKTTLPALVAVVALLPLSSHALEAVVQGDVGSGSAMAGSLGAVNARADALQANLTATNTVINQLKSDITNLQQQVADLSLMIKNSYSTSDTSIGKPLFAKIVSTEDFNVFNNSIKNWILPSSNTEQTKQNWLNACLMVNGQIPATFTTNPLIWEYCMRAFCNSQTGVWPFMARMSDQCAANNGDPDCNRGKFYISAQCLSTKESSPSTP